MRKKTAGLAALICAAELISVTQTETVQKDREYSYANLTKKKK